MRRLELTLALLLPTLLLTGSPAFGQATTGSISGQVRSSDGLPLPGVTVTAASPDLQGVRTAITSESGDYLIPLLPPGTYSVSFNISEFQTVTRTQQIGGAYQAALDVTMSLSGVSEQVTVIADAQLYVNTAQVTTNYKQSLMATLPTTRSIEATLQMAPSVHATGPGGAFSIGGGMSYENVYTVNGAVIVENLRGSAYPLYIEDAIQEVTVATAAVSAEYGRFTGGMVSAVTKSGGNTFSGSLRTSFANDYWRSLTPAANDPKRDSKAPKPGTVPMYEATFGGPVKKERLWFFGATRIRNEEATRQTAVTAIPYVRGNDEKRYEGKLTFAARPNHSIQGSYIGIDQVQSNYSPQSFRVMDERSLTVQNQPSNLVSVRYTGIIAPNFSVEVMYSRKHLTLDSGAPTRDRIEGTLLVDNARNNRYWSPTFCGICEDEKRDNDNIVAKGSYFLSTRAFGAHHLVAGFDRFNDKMFQNAYQSGSDYRIMGTTAIIKDTAVFPQFLSGSTLIQYNPVQVSSIGSDLRMYSSFFNDAWRLNEHLSFNLGIRWDRNNAQDGGGAVVANTGLWSPRVAAVWDPIGDGRLAFNASYARYVMPMTSNVAASTTAAGNAATFVWQYLGPAINQDPNGTLVTSDAAIQQVFNWFDSNGGPNRPTIGSFVPGVNVQIQTPLKSPNADEYAIGTSRQLGTRGTLRVDGVWRRYHDFYSQRADLTTGRVTDSVGNVYDLFLVENTNDVTRRYSGLTTQGTYRIRDAVDVGGNYTLSYLRGNFDGETASAGPSVTQVNAYPEYKRAEWNSPDGYLAADQRHRARFWGTYVAPMPGNAGTVTLGLLQQVASGTPYGALGTGSSGVNAAPYVVPPPGYQTPQAPLNAVDYYFTARDAFRTETTFRTDFSVNYAYRFRGGRAQPELFFHGEVLNVFRDFQMCGCGGSAFSNGGGTDMTTIGQAIRVFRNTPTLAQFNPFTTVPVQGVNWDYNTTPGSAFGTALSQFAFTTPRLFRFSAGIRF
jgi:hypothetical protein